MKKLFTLAAIALLWVGAAFAQSETKQVSPINVRLTEFNLDSLRANASDDNNYLSSLKQVQMRLKIDEQNIKMEAQRLKAEQAHYKTQVSILNGRQKQLKQQDKVYQEEVKLHKKDRKELAKQRKDLFKNKSIDIATQQDLLQQIDDRDQRLTEAENTLNQKIFSLYQQQEDIKHELIELAELNYALQNKDIEIKSLQSNNKLQQTTIEAEIKNISGQIKQAKTQIKKENK